jgi:hypothetical protein
MQSLEINPQSYIPEVFKNGAKNTHWRKDSLFNKQCWESRVYQHAEEWNYISLTRYKN